MHAPIKYFEKGLSIAANGAWGVFNTLNKISQNPAFTPKWSDKPLQKSYQKTKPPLGWPRETDSLCPIVHARGSPGDSRRQEGRQRPAEREGRRDQGDHPRARRPDPDGEGLPHSRPLRRRDGDRYRLLQAPRAGLPRPRHPRPQRRQAAQPRQQHGAARPRVGADGRPDEPLQHDVRPLLHGREPGRVRP